MNAEDFNEKLALKAALALDQVLRARKHRRVHLGEEIWVQGRLGEALNLPKTLKQLQSKVAKRRESGLMAFQALWPTLSASTQQQVLDTIGWYDADTLDWDDKRSNRRARPDED